MIDRNQVKAELKMRIRFAAGGNISVSGTLLENALELLEEDEKRMGTRFSRWVEPADHGNYVTEGGDPIFCCENCGGSYHVYGVEHPQRKLICDNCGCVNLYPWEESYDETSSLAQE